MLLVSLVRCCGVYMRVSVSSDKLRGRQNKAYFPVNLSYNSEPIMSKHPFFGSRFFSSCIIPEMATQCGETDIWYGSRFLFFLFVLVHLFKI